MDELRLSKAPTVLCREKFYPEPQLRTQAYVNEKREKYVLYIIFSGRY